MVMAMRTAGVTPAGGSSSILLLHSCLVAVQLGYGGFQILARLALTGGVNLIIFPVYRNALAFLFLGPLAFYFEREKRPPLTSKVVWSIFNLSCTGILCTQLFILVGLKYTSALFGATIINSGPAFTLVLAITLRQETLNLRRLSGYCKLFGTVLSVLGAMVMTLYKGPVILSDGLKIEQGYVHLPEIHNEFTVVQPSLCAGCVTWQLGGLCLLGSCVTWALFLIFQGSLLKTFPAPLSIAAGTNFFGTIQFSVVALLLEHKASDWAITWGPQLVGVLYATWCIQRGGPVLAAMYQPVETLAVAIVAFLTVGDTFYMGSLIGGICSIAGLYLITWGNTEEVLPVDAIENKSLNCRGPALQETWSENAGEPFLHENQ
ncbi:hypothetical protein O6H91_13G073000 [Diphasiastrum complanatum]|uniref:Uncharacterized protein n=1 Tax=Diphasiastrum complanatum TaxID=34168 RepID=A0ACC2BW78_DIPCM|nr:hypothetical protein O6H91_13G073000 [Diphasiastrum complanatum]